MELIGHSIKHYNGTEELDRKLVILHLANAIELIFKDIVLNLGESIYKNPKETVTVYACFEMLKSKQMDIPLRNHIELLIDERNAIQHRFGSPNELTCIYYMTIAEDFFRQILDKHYQKDFDEVMSQFAARDDWAVFRMRKPRNESELENLKRLSKVHPLGALLSAMTYLERKMYDFSLAIGLGKQFVMSRSWNYMSHRYFQRFGIDIPEDLEREIDEVRDIRNSAAHGRKEPTRQEADRCISAVEKFENFLDTVDVEKVRARVEQYEKSAYTEDKSELHPPYPAMQGEDLSKTSSSETAPSTSTTAESAD